jgi:hypothetical protein
MEEFIYNVQFPTSYNDLGLSTKSSIADTKL